MRHILTSVEDILLYWNYAITNEIQNIQHYIFSSMKHSLNTKNSKGEKDSDVSSHRTYLMLRAR